MNKTPTRPAWTTTILPALRPRRAVWAGALALIFLVTSAGWAAEPPAADRIEPVPTAPAWVPGYRIRWSVRMAGWGTNVVSRSVIAAIPTGGWLKPDGSDVAVQGADGAMIPVRVLSHDPTGNTIIQFARQGTNRWYWAYGVNPNAAPALPEPVSQIAIVTNQTGIVTNQVVIGVPPIGEGLVMEVREWAGQRLDSWADAVEGLHKSETVIGNAIATEIVHHDNPFRPTNPRNFAASYRGYLNITNTGPYRLLANADDAAFVFIDGFKVFERPGANLAKTGRLPVGTGGGVIDLTSGVHTIEVHHVMGNAPQGSGVCTLGWITPGEKRWAVVPRTAFVQPAYSVVGPPEEVNGGPAVSFNWGIDDPLVVSELTLFLFRFEAAGKIANPDALVWDMGDGSTHKGRSFRHVYLGPGEYKVTLKSADGLPLFTRRVFAWPAFVGDTSPLTLPRMLQAFRDTDWRKYDFTSIYRIYQFLDAAELPDGWPLLEAVCQHLLAQPNQDPAVRAGVYHSLMTALAEQGRAREALAVGEKALPEFVKTDALQVVVRLALGDVQFRYLKDADAAVKQYKDIIDRFDKLDAPEVRLAAVRMGDVAIELGDIGGAADAYRLARRLGGRQYQTSETMDAVTHGAQLRIVEQRLRAGNIAECRALLRKIEIESPEQKLQGYYTLLRAEVDRAGGRYDQAIAGYQRVLSAVQWSGFHDRSTFGIADCYMRKGDLLKAQQVMAKIKEVFPKLYETEKLADYDNMISNRLAHAVAPAPTAVDTNAPPVPKRWDLAAKPFETGFEPEERGDCDFHAPKFPIVMGQGLNGPHVLLIDNVPQYFSYCGWQLRFTNMVPGGWYWLEGWYRDTESSRMFSGAHVAAFVNNPAGAVLAGQFSLSLDASHGLWRKFSMLLHAPLTIDGTFLFDFRYTGPFHCTEVDAITIAPVTDRQVDALQNFVRQREQREEQP